MNAVNEYGEYGDIMLSRQKATAHLKNKIIIVRRQDSDTIESVGCGSWGKPMVKLPIIAVFCGAALLGGSAWAATVQPGQGNLSVNQGQGFRPINSRVDANVGDSVMVDPGGAATVVYDDGCVVNVEPGTVTMIAPLSPCTSGSYAQTQTQLQEYAAYLAAGGTLGLVAWLAYEASHSNNSSTPPPAPVTAF